MKKASKTITLILAVLLAAGTVTGCQVMMAVATPMLAVGAAGAGAIVAGKAVVAIDEAAGDEAAKKTAAARGRKATLDELHGEGSKHFPNDLEDRLTRRTSTLAGGTPIDITPYLVHSDSFAVIDGNIEYCKNVFDFAGGKETDYPAFEVDTTVSYEINNQKYQENLSALNGYRGSLDKDSVKKNLNQYVAKKHGVNASGIKNFKVKFDKPRKTNKKPRFFKNVFIEDTAPVYYEFDVDVEYQKFDAKAFKTVQPTDYATFSKVYRSDCKTLAGAALDVQLQIWEDAKKLSKRGRYDQPVPVPRVNFVNAVKYSN